MELLCIHFRRDPKQGKNKAWQNSHTIRNVYVNGEGTSTQVTGDKSYGQGLVNPNYTTTLEIK